MPRPARRLFDYEVARLDGDGALDGDTLEVWVWTTRYDQGWRRIRVLDIEAPDDTVPGPGVSYGVAEAERFVAGWLEGRGRLRVTTRDEDSFGRALGDLYDAATGEHLDLALFRYLREIGLDPVYRRP